MHDWHSYVSETRPLIDPGLMQVLHGSPEYAERAGIVQELSLALDRLAGSLPTSLEDIGRPSKIAAQLHEVMENLPAEIPEAVRELFKAMSQETATAGLLSEEAISWLRDRHMLDKISVTWRSD